MDHMEQSGRPSVNCCCVCMSGEINEMFSIQKTRDMFSLFSCWCLFAQLNLGISSVDTGLLRKDPHNENLYNQTL